MHTTLSPYLNFNGNCREAMQFYQSVLGGELTMQSYGEAGYSDSSAQKDKIIHASLKSNDLSLMACDGPQEKAVTFGNNVHLSINGSEEKTLREYFEKLSAGGIISMPLEKQFWGDIFGMFTDKFGVHWMINISSQ
ncbi:MAG: VOC family protein [Candidatus Harrisonbacteria bacterium]|nr:VOC family protein [Candidatus Harrisonbacteria bacterium]